MPRGLILDEKGIDKVGVEGEKHWHQSGWVFGSPNTKFGKKCGFFFLFFYASVVFMSAAPNSKAFASKTIKAANALKMTGNDSGLKINEKCKIPGYKYFVW
jgi:hypothetical protein